MSNQVDSSAAAVACPYCGKQNPQLAVHCAECGKEIKGSPSPRKKGGQSLVREFIAFIKHEKKWWMIPLIAVLLIVGLLIVLGSSSPLAPFIYPLF